MLLLWPSLQVSAVSFSEAPTRILSFVEILPNQNEKVITFLFLLSQTEKGTNCIVQSWLWSLRGITCSLNAIWPRTRGLLGHQLDSLTLTISSWFCSIFSWSRETRDGHSGRIRLRDREPAKWCRKNQLPGLILTIFFSLFFLVLIMTIWPWMTVVTVEIQSKGKYGYVYHTYFLPCQPESIDRQNRSTWTR